MIPQQAAKLNFKVKNNPEDPHFQIAKPTNCGCRYARNILYVYTRIAFADCVLCTAPSFLVFRPENEQQPPFHSPRRTIPSIFIAGRGAKGTREDEANTSSGTTGTRED